jgi:hypothetical protein
MACGCNDEAGVGRTVQCLHGALHSMYSDGTCGRVQGKHENAAFGRIEFVDGTAISLGSYRYCRISFHSWLAIVVARSGCAAIIGGKGISQQ